MGEDDEDPVRSLSLDQKHLQPLLPSGRVLENALDPSAAQKYRELGRYGPLILLGIVMLDNFAHTGIISRVLIGPMFHLAHLFAGDNFFRLLPLLQ